MSESAIESGGPSLEQLLWRAVDRYSEQPALIDSDEFADRIAEAFEGDVPAEAFVDRFFRGDDAMRGPASDMAEAVVRATRNRMHVYEFNLNQLEYVIIEDKDKVVVVSDFGQFAFDNDDAVTRAIEAAIVPAGAPGASVSSDGTPVRDGAEPRAYFVRSTGETVAIDVKKVSRALEQFFVKQVTHAAVEAPGARMMPFAPTRRRLSEEREVSALRQDTRMRMAVPPPPPGLDAGVSASRGAWGVRARNAAQERFLAPPAGAETTVFVLLPDGSLARPAIGSATRWQEMVGDWVARAASSGAVAGFGGIASASTASAGSSGYSSGSSRSSSTPLPFGSEQRFMVQAGNVVAIISGGERQQGGTVGERAYTRSQAISQVRGDSAPIRILGDDELARAISRGAMIVPGLAKSDQGSSGDRFWIQPEMAFAPTQQQQQRAQLGSDSPQGGELVENGGRQGVASSGGEPLQLGQITGDPWADWALTGGGQEPAAAFLAARNRPRGLFRAAVDRARDGSGDAPPGLAQRLGVQREVLLHGAPVIGFRAADGSLVLQRGSGPIRLAALDRPSGDFESAAPQSQTSGWRGQPLAFRAGALPASALVILRSALEQTARAGGYKLPAVRLDSAFDALDVGQAMQLAPDDARRKSVRMAGGVDLRQSPSGQVAQMVLSMPFPNRGEVHVGSDLTEALQAYLGGQVVPAGSNGTSWTAGTGAARSLGGGLVDADGVGGRALGAGGPGAVGLASGLGAGALVLKLRGGNASRQTFVEAGAQPEMDFGAMHGSASKSAQDAMVTLTLPEVQPLLAGRASFSGLPTLLRSALGQAGEWSPGPGAAMPLALRQLALQGRFDMPELVDSAPISSNDDSPRPLRALNAGEDEIVIPMPLWAQMGRGRISATEQIMASPRAPRGYAPPLGSYELVATPGAPLDYSNGRSDAVQLSGPSSLELAITSPMNRGVHATSPSGRHLLARVALDGGPADSSGPASLGGSIAAGSTVAGTRPSDSSSSDSSGAQRASGLRRGRGKLGAPLDSNEAQDRVEAARQSVASSRTSPGAMTQSTLAESAPGQSLVTGATPSVPGQSVVSGAAPGAYTPSSSVVTGANGSFQRLDFSSASGGPGGASFGSAAVRSGGRPMAGALNSALQMSNQVSARGLPVRPSLDAASAASFGGGSGSSAGFAARAASAGESEGMRSVGGFTRSSLGGSSVDTDTLVTGPSRSGLTSAAQSQLDVGEGEMSRASNSAVSSSSSSTPDSGSGPSSSSRMTGMAPGMWSGASRFSTPGYQPWNYAASRPNTQVINGGVNLSGLDRPSWPSLPTSLRFRYAGAPLWWSGSTSRGGTSAASFDSGSSDAEAESGVGARMLRSGLRAATSAASIWRSILVAGPSSGSSAEQSDASGGMDANREGNADQMSSLGRKFDALTAASLVTGGGAAGAAGGKGAESLYVAMNQAGDAGVASKSAVQRAKADALEMSIVAAIPAAPPSLESSGSSATGGDAPHARSKGHHAEQHGHGHKEGGDAVSHSKIEGSVDAIAQRIYHRIRRRIQSDRERFGG